MTNNPVAETSVADRGGNNGKARKYRPGRIRERNREKIIKAAEEEFALNGYKGATIQNIAERAGLPKSNVLYYFSNKKRMYSAMFDDILGRWNKVFSDVTPEDDPAKALSSFIRTKVEMSHRYPLASRLFATEIIQGGPFLMEHLRTNMREWMRGRAEVIQQWIDEGRMAKVDPVQLIFLVWSSTQHYADFQVQILMVENKAEYEQRDFDHAADFLTDVILRGCGLEKPT
jgi:TetR/AcrR family transcriptional regulator